MTIRLNQRMCLSVIASRARFHRVTRRLAAPVIALAFCLMAGIAAAGEETVVIIGIGSGTCASFLEDIETRPQAQGEYFSWAQGYMSGLLIRAPIGETVDLNPPLLPLAKQAIFLHMFCTQKSHARFADGVEFLYKLLRQPNG